MRATNYLDPLMRLETRSDESQKPAPPPSDLPDTPALRILG